MNRQDRPEDVDRRRWARLWAAARPHDMEGGGLGEYAALCARRGEAAARRAYPAMAAHLAAGCDACTADLADLGALLAEETPGRVVEPRGGPIVQDASRPMRSLSRRLAEPQMPMYAESDVPAAQGEPRPPSGSEPVLREAAALRYEVETVRRGREEQERFLGQLREAWQEAQRALRQIHVLRDEVTAFAQPARPVPGAALGTAGSGPPAPAAEEKPSVVEMSGEERPRETLWAEIAALRAEVASLRTATGSLRRLVLATSSGLLAAIALLAWLAGR